MRAALIFGVASLLCASAVAQTAARIPTAPSPQPASVSSITTLETVSVTGVLPGPGLWKVSRDGHVLWVLGVIPSLPAGMQWRSAEVETAIAGSREVIESPDAKVKIDANFFGKLFLLPSALGARKNPDGKTLRDLLPPGMYARWQALKPQYLGDDDGIERWRPIFAALKLYREALKKNGLRSSGEVEDTVAALARQHGIDPVSSDYTLTIREPRQAIKAFEAEGPDGIACFGRTLDSIEHDIPAMRARANAWSTGDLDTLRKLPDSRFRQVCTDAITGAGFARRLGIADLPDKVEAHWLNLARGALKTFPQSFAVLPMHDVMDGDGALAVLRSQGYTVQSPDELASDPAEAATAGP
ncbi:MAG: TraB/GumN family protein [Proteobacteria bacterium]|nr:TraB/GumN family protein [Pseudomonadota bacterium]